MSAPPAAVTAGRPTSRWALRAAGWRDFGRRFLRRPEGLIGISIILFFTVLAIAPVLLVGPLETVTTASARRATSSTRSSRRPIPASK